MFNDIPVEQLVPFASAIVFVVAVLREQEPRIDGRLINVPSAFAGRMCAESSGPFCVTRFERKGRRYLRVVALRHNGDEYQYATVERRDREVVLPADHDQLVEIVSLLIAGTASA